MTTCISDGLASIGAGLQIASLRRGHDWKRRNDPGCPSQVPLA